MARQQPVKLRLAEASVEVRVLPDASRGRKLNVKLADSNPAFLGSNPGAPANPKKGMRDEG